MQLEKCEDSPDLDDLQNRYQGMLIIKAFKKGLQENPIDELNYFKAKEFEEGKNRGINQ